MTPLSELIRIMRKKALLSQEDFAKALNVSAKIGQGTGGCHHGAAGAAPGGGGLLRPMVAAERRDCGLLWAEHATPPAANAAEGVSLS